MHDRLLVSTLVTRTGPLLVQNSQAQQDTTGDFYLKIEKYFVPNPDKALTLMSTPPHGEQSV